MIAAQDLIAIDGAPAAWRAVFTGPVGARHTLGIEPARGGAHRDVAIALAELLP